MYKNKKSKEEILNRIKTEVVTKKKQKANCGDKHEEMDLQPTINENVSSEKLYLL